MKTTSIRKYKPKEKGLSGSTLKIIALICMIIDHTGVAIVRYLPNMSNKESFTYALYWILRLTGRLAFPIFCFLLVEGIKHTHDKFKYALRLFVFCIISEIPFDIALFGSYIDIKHQNVFFTLFLGFIMLCIFNIITTRGTSPIPSLMVKIIGVLGPAAYFTYKSVNYFRTYSKIEINDLFLYLIAAIVWLYLLYNSINKYAHTHGQTGGLNLCAKLVVLATTMLVADLLHTDYNSAGILTIAFMYMYRNNPFSQMISGCIVLTALSSPAEMTAFATAPLIQKYNGKKGLNLKYAFYVAYPLHLLILYIIAVLTGLRVLQPLVL